MGFFAFCTVPFPAKFTFERILNFRFNLQKYILAIWTVATVIFLTPFNHSGYLDITKFIEVFFA